MMRHLEPIQRRVAELEKNPEEVIETLNNGTKRCKQIAESVMDEVREKMGLRK
jgi:hypothetical protein